MQTGKEEIGNATFHFSCHPGVACFTRCCRQLRLYLYPYDILRLKNRLRIHSAEFMRLHTVLARGSHPYFPSVMLRMAENREKSCPFLDKDDGCTVYRDRPSACRSYPLERGVEKLPTGGPLREHYYLTRHSYCLGHQQQQTHTVARWIRSQQLYEFNMMNDLWAEVDAMFATNPWQGEGSGGPLQQLAFMVCYNIDGFREYADRHRLLSRFRLERDRRRRIARDDTELLKFGFEWLQLILIDKPTLRPR